MLKVFPNLDLKTLLQKIIGLIKMNEQIMFNFNYFRNEIRWKNTTIQNSKYEETDSSLTPTRTYLGLTNLNSENKNSIENTRRKMMETKFFAKD